ncbi:protein of unknown function (DUF305) [Spirosoma oryzae]|uniref:DUF305 domain-containing protein n=2 Tax=Spirosoma TaxID=107 RepID=D2QVS4_SPILD|nr:MULTISPECIES: DUF305 domain-containing protein [Spirosoma]ADB42906.1 protein of unknown function DUF305 [Spirosoma linguale DSM 74]MBR8837135.1 DUF305 domain-containing protein [Stigonema ocellatum SAG 48.90 = DSM 106950]MCX6213850.1 DUF305 domain-containing protein [Spirosoma sp.]PRY34954.1 protein of unknown function (DUF305) [Spirosoma oryzae]
MNMPATAKAPMQSGHYGRFFLMLGVSFVVMNALTYANLEQADHFYLSTNRLYVTFLMISAMALIMLGFMRAMYTDRRMNQLIIGGSVLVFATALFCIRNQVLINDQRFMQSMIPHHSIAILVSKRAELKDPEVKELAQSIITAQEREIAQMKRILVRMDQK